MKYLHHIIISRTSAILTSSALVELPVFSLCFLETFTMAHFPIDIIGLVWLLLSQCTPHNTSTHHLIMFRLSALMCLFIYSVPFRYFSPCFNFPQSSSSGSFTLVVRKDTSGSISGWAHLHRKRSRATVRWNCLACSSGSNLRSASSLISNKWSPAGEGLVDFFTLGNSSMTFCR